MELIGEVVELRSGALLEEVGHWVGDAFPILALALCFLVCRGVFSHTLP